MQVGITYSIAHSGRYFYILLKEAFNEVNNKLIRVPIPGAPLELLETQKKEQKESSEVQQTQRIATEGSE